MNLMSPEQISETVKQIAQSGNVSEEELVKLTDHVMEYMLTTGQSYIKTANLSVDIDFTEATIRKFYLFSDDGNRIDLLKYSQKFTKRLVRNQKEGIKKLSKDIFDDLTGIQINRVLVFGKN